MGKGREQIETINVVVIAVIALCSHHIKKDFSSDLKKIFFYSCSLKSTMFNKPLYICEMHVEEQGQKNLSK